MQFKSINPKYRSKYFLSVEWKHFWIRSFSGGNALSVVAADGVHSAVDVLQVLLSSSLPGLTLSWERERERERVRERGGRGERRGERGGEGEREREERGGGRERERGERGGGGERRGERDGMKYSRTSCVCLIAEGYKCTLSSLEWDLHDYCKQHEETSCCSDTNQ